MMGGSGGSISRAGSDKMLSVLSNALIQCSGQAHAYGSCAQKMLPEVRISMKGILDGMRCNDDIQCRYYSIMVV